MANARPGGDRRTRILVQLDKGIGCKSRACIGPRDRSGLVAVIAECSFVCENRLRKRVIGSPVMGVREGREGALAATPERISQKTYTSEPSAESFRRGFFGSHKGSGIVITAFFFTCRKSSSPCRGTAASSFMPKQGA